MDNQFLQIITLHNGDIMVWDWEWCGSEDYLLIPADNTTDEEISETILNRWTVEDGEIPYLLKIIKGHRMTD